MRFLSNARRKQRFQLSIALLWSMTLVFAAPALLPDQRLLAQDSAEPAGTPGSIVDAADIQSVMNDEPTQQPGSDQPSGIDLLSLIARGGRFMIPIGLMSMLVVTLSVERMLSLRTEKILPRSLVNQITDLAAKHESFPPSTAQEICIENPSPAARVVSAMLMRTGQPLGDIERAAGEALQREADRYAGPVRWLTLAAAATPLMGLLGTVWGMIVAFHESSTLTADRSRSEQLSEGIYTALVTTLAGLAVAIPAAILAQYLENRIAKLFHRIEELAFVIAPGLVRFVGRSRMDEEGQLRPLDNGTPPPMAIHSPPPVASS
ncbi:MotA/TolQ/ExbB proton channel family protein [Rhodopirellula sp. JC737]|nr:MotA/TolQ/ExbB proton channel family protein [Rhodopirellula sp. JC737]